MKRYVSGQIEANSKYDQLLRMYNKKVDFDILKQSKTLIDPKPIVKTAGKIITIAPKEDSFLYLRNRAISSGNVIEHKDGTCEEVPLDIFWGNFEKYDKITRGANANGDWWSCDELRKAVSTFKGVSVFCEHENDNVEKARGIVLDAIYNEKGHFIETLLAIDAEAYPQLARSIKLGYVTSTSMGCTCTSSKCSICRNEIHCDEDICFHLANYKGMKFNGLNCFEESLGTSFFEDSIVVQPADENAKIMEIVKTASKNNRNLKWNAYIHTKDNALLNERNQRFASGRTESIAEKLKNLPWS